MQQVAFLETRRAVGEPLLINEKRERQAGLLPEQAGVGSIAKSHGSQIYSVLPERWLVFAQLRDMLPAENSPIVPQEDNNRGRPFPKRSEPHFAAITIRQRNIRQCLANRMSHLVGPDSGLLYFRSCTTTPSRISSAGLTMMVCPSDNPDKTSISWP